MIALAGYLLQLACDPTAGSGLCQVPLSDLNIVLGYLATMARDDADEAVQAVETCRRKVIALFNQPRILATFTDLIPLLLEERYMTGDALRKHFFHGQCGAAHPRDASKFCNMGPHRYGPHTAITMPDKVGGRPAYEYFPGFSMSHDRRRNSSVPTSVRTIRAIHAGGHPWKLPKGWSGVLNRLDQPSRETAEMLNDSELGATIRRVHASPWDWWLP